MYCSSCGVAVAQGLSYCNYCGAKLSGVKGDSVTKSSEVRPEYLVFAMMAVFVFGLAAITVLMGVMKTVLGLPVERILAFALLPFLFMVVLEGVFIRPSEPCHRTAAAIKCKHWPKLYQTYRRAKSYFPLRSQRGLKVRRIAIGSRGFFYVLS